MKKMSKLVVITSVMLMMSTLVIGCGTLFPNIATIYVQNDTENSYTTGSATVDEEVEFEDLYIHGAGVETEKQGIKKGKFGVYTLTWYGERANFNMGGKYTHTLTIDSPSTGDEPVTSEFTRLKPIADVGNGDSVLVKFTLDRGEWIIEIKKEYKYTGDETAVGSRKQD